MRVEDVSHVGKNLFVLWLYKYYYDLNNGSLPGNFKISDCPLKHDSKKVTYLLKRKVCGEGPYAIKAKAKFHYRLNNYESKHGAFS